MSAVLGRYVRIDGVLLLAAFLLAQTSSSGVGRPPSQADEHSAVDIVTFLARATRAPAAHED